MPKPPRKRKPRVYPSLADRPPCDASLRVSMLVLDRLRATAKRRRVWIRLLVEDAIMEYLDRIESPPQAPEENSPPQADDGRRAA